MKITTEQALFLRDIYFAKLEQEFVNNKKVIGAIPEGKYEYRPDPKAKTAFELAWHLASSEIWFLRDIVRGDFSAEGANPPAEINSIKAIITWYETNFHTALENVRAMSAEALAKNLNFFNVLNLPAVMYLSILADHSIHHRGQLTTYLRPMGGKAPSIYGGSADEPFMPQ